MLEEYRDWIELGKYVSAIVLSIGIVSWMSQQVRAHVSNLSAHMTVLNNTVMEMQRAINKVNRSLERHVDHSQELRGEITGRIDVVEKKISTVTMRKGDKHG